MARKAYCGAEWNGPSQGQIDPLKEVKAAQQRVENGFSTRTRETVELGNGDFFRNNRLRIEEEKLRREGGLVNDEGNESIIIKELEETIEELEEKGS